MEDAGDYFSLKWSDFRSSLTEGFHDFLQEEAMVDVTLAAEGNFVQAHKLVLSVCSPYFKNLFKVNPCKHPIVILKDVGHNDLSYLLEFMYKGEVGVKHEDLPSFLKLADTLKVKGLAGEKIQKNENSSTKNLDVNISRVRKLIKRDPVSDVNKENSEFYSCGEQSVKKVLRSKKRRLSCKSESVKKLKSEKSVDSVNKCKDENNENISEDEDNNPLIKFIGGDSVKSGEGSKQSESQCDNENESQCDNKTSFSVWSDGVAESDESGGQDMNSFFQSGYSEEPEQTPQGVRRSPLIKKPEGRVSALKYPLWKYYSEGGAGKLQCVCCRRIFKFVPGFSNPSNLVRHLRLHENLFYTYQKEKFEMTVGDSSKDNYNGLNLFSPNKRANPVWDYFQLEGDKAICRLCHKRLAYKNHMYLTSLSNHLASKRHGHHEHYLEYVSKKNEMMKEADVFNNLFFRMGKRISSSADLSIIRHHLQ